MSNKTDPQSGSNHSEDEPPIVKHGRAVEAGEAPSDDGDTYAEFEAWQREVAERERQDREREARRRRFAGNMARLADTPDTVAATSEFDPKERRPQPAENWTFRPGGSRRGYI